MLLIFCLLYLDHPSLTLLPNLCDLPVPRTPPRNIQVYNPTPDSLKVRWEPASGQVQQYRVAYSALRGTARPESVSGTPGHQDRKMSPKQEDSEIFTASERNGSSLSRVIKAVVI